MIYANGGTNEHIFESLTVKFCENVILYKIFTDFLQKDIEPKLKDGKGQKIDRIVEGLSTKATALQKSN